MPAGPAGDSSGTSGAAEPLLLPAGIGISAVSQSASAVSQSASASANQLTPTPCPCTAAPPPGIVSTTHSRPRGSSRPGVKRLRSTAWRAREQGGGSRWVAAEQARGRRRQQRRQPQQHAAAAAAAAVRRRPGVSSGSTGSKQAHHVLVRPRPAVVPLHRGRPALGVRRHVAGHPRARPAGHALVEAVVWEWAASKRLSQLAPMPEQCAPAHGAPAAHPHPAVAGRTCGDSRRSRRRSSTALVVCSTASPVPSRYQSSSELSSPAEAWWGTRGASELSQVADAGTTQQVPVVVGAQLACVAPHARGGSRGVAGMIKSWPSSAMQGIRGGAGLAVLRARAAASKPTHPGTRRRTSSAEAGGGRPGPGGSACTPGPGRRR